MKIIYLFFLFAGTTALGQIIDFPDPNFKIELLNHSPAVDTNGDGQIQVSEAVVVESLSFNIGNIVDMAGIEYFESLENLGVRYHDLEILDLSQNTELKVLDCTGNEITNLILPDSGSLEYLRCGDNLLTSIDLSGASDDFYHLRFDYNFVTSIDVSRFELTYFWAHDNLMTEVILGDQPFLENIWLRNNNLKAIDVSGCPLLEILSLHYSDISSIDVTNNPKLRILGMYDNNLSEIDLSNNLDLISLSVDGNNLSSLDISNNLNVFNLQARNNSITSIDLSNNNFLQTVLLSNNQLENIVFRDEVTDIEKLLLDNNQLVDLSVASDELKEFDAHNNLLTSLDLFNGNTGSQQYVDLSSNLFTSLDLTQVRARNLNVSNNLELLSIDLQNGFNWRIDMDQSNFTDLSNIETICLDLYGGTDELIAEIQTQVGPDVAFYNNEDCSELILSTEDFTENSLTAYPNPVSDLLTVNSAVPIATMVVYDRLGVKVIEANNSNQIDFSALPSGLYVIHLTDIDNQKAVKKVIKR